MNSINKILLLILFVCLIASDLLAQQRLNADTTVIQQDSYSGFSFTVDVSAGQETSKTNSYGNIIGIHSLLGYMYKSKFIIGLSSGFTDYGFTVLGSGNEYTFFDCTTAFRFFPFHGKLVPLISADAGYGFDGGDNISGLILSTGLGGRFNLTDKRAINASLNYRSQKFRIKGYNPLNGYSSSKNEKFAIENICLSLGFSF